MIGLDKSRPDWTNKDIQAQDASIDSFSLWQKVKISARKEKIQESLKNEIETILEFSPTLVHVSYSAIVPSSRFLSKRERKQLPFMSFMCHA